MEKKRNEIFTNLNVKLDVCGKTERGNYELESLKDLIKEIPFNKISIPVYSYKSLIIDKNKPGTVQVGYINSYDEKTGLFGVAIYTTTMVTVETFKDVVIYARCLVKNGIVNKITGFDICPQDYHK